MRLSSANTGPMKLHFETIIDASLDTAWSAFDIPDDKGRWQTNLLSDTHMSGEPGRPGSVAELKFNKNGKIIVLTETITARRDRSFHVGARYNADRKSLRENR